MPNFKVIALDPGGTTGWATFAADRMPDGELYAGVWRRGHLGPGQHHDLLYAFLEMETVATTHIVSESFEYRNRARAGLVLDSKEYIGVTKLFCQQRKLIYYSQTAAQGKGFVKDDNIKRLDLWRPGWKHAMDATRHLLYFLIHNPVVSAPDLRRQLLEAGWK
jgi:hypothetical protein